MEYDGDFTGASGCLEDDGSDFNGWQDEDSYDLGDD